MSVLVWDGTTLAADRQCTIGTLKLKYKKIFCGEDFICGFVGDTDFGEAMVDWYFQGRKKDDFPKSIDSSATATMIIILEKTKEILLFSKSPYPGTYQPQSMAIGSGGDFAMGALSCGKNAIEAVEIACQLDAHCGNGVDFLRFN